MQQLQLFHSNDGYANARHFYVYIYIACSIWYFFFCKFFNKAVSN